MTRKLASKAELLIIVLFACIPLFIHLPYRVNIFLSWEGAYRISGGQLPFRDFGTPLGGMYWVIPAIFFKIFGPGLFSLIKAQVFINIVAGLSFRSILRSLGVNKGVRLASVLLFVLSYSFFNFWPWYNHSVIVYEIAGLACLLRYVRADMDVRGRFRWIWLAGAALLTVCSFLTKQDGGGIAFFMAAGLITIYSWLARKWSAALIFVGSFFFFILVLIGPFLSHGFGYWFNHGQAPHSSRVSSFDIVAELFGSSQWIKFYLFLIIFLVAVRWQRGLLLKADIKTVLLIVLGIGMLGEAAILQVTSYTPPDNNIFFHSFAFPCILSLLVPLLPVRMEQPRVALLLMAGILFWWSGVWWKYTQRLAGPFLSKGAVVSPTGENVVNKDTYMISRDTMVKDIPTEQWVESGLPAFRKITLPAPTVAGIQRLLAMDVVKSYRERLRSGKSGAGADLKVLNMSELTPLAAEIPYTLERNSQLPLWYHLGVGMFNRQADTFETRIRQHYYDLVLFEYVPTLNNFYPFRVRDSLRLHYPQVDSFLAPRRGPETQGVIEVYVRPADPLSR
jgi:hypothetical protein